MSRLQLRPEFHRAIRALKLVELASAVLKVRPLQRTLPHGSRYRVRYGESLLMADEIFKREVYRDPFLGRTVRTFVDLGSNVGYFTCYAADRIGKDAVGLAVLKELGATEAIMNRRIFEQEQIARAVELGLGVAGPDAIEIVTRDAESARYAEKLRAILRLG